MLKSLRKAVLTGGLAVACALPAAAPASAAWEHPKAIDGAGSGYGATQSDALSVGPGGTATALFVQPAPGSPSGGPGSPFMTRRPAGATAAWSAPGAIATPSGQLSLVPQPVVSSAPGGALGDGGVQGLFWFAPSSTTSQLGTSTWPVSSSGPSAMGAAPCTTAAIPECPSSGGGTPHVAFDAAGNEYVVADGASGDILLWRIDPATGTWPRPITVGRGGFPRLAVDPAGDVVVTYVRTDNTIPVNPVNRLYAKRELAGQTSFGSEHQISGSGSVSEGNDPFALVIDPSGTATAVFIEQQNPVVSAVEAVRWSLASDAPDVEQQISGAPQDEGPLPGDATATVDPHGAVTAAWDSASPGTSVYAAQLTGGKWGTPSQVSPSNGRTAAHPALAADATGTVTLIYSDSQPPTGSDADVKAMRLPLGGTWSAPVSLRSADPNAGAVQSAFPQVASARAGQADVTFIQQLSGTNRLFATRFDDTTPPVIQVVTPHDGATYRQGTTVLADYSCVDERGGSGLASCSGPASAGQPIDTSSAGTKAFTVAASDAAGNTAAKTVHYTVLAGPPPADKTPPRITLRVPRDGASYAQGQRVLASFSCADPDSPVKSCRGTTANGRAIDTRTLGRHSFSVIAQDPAGNTASKTVHYTVAKAPGLLKLKLTVAPHRVRAGRRVRLRFRALSCAGARCAGGPRVQITFAHRRKRTNARGYATFTVTLRKPGRYRAYARAPGYRPATAVVIARRR